MTLIEDMEQDSPIAHTGAPFGARYYGLGRYFKFGVHGKAFVWVNNRWRTTTTPMWDIQRMEGVRG